MYCFSNQLPLDIIPYLVLVFLLPEQRLFLGDLQSLHVLPDCPQHLLKLNNLLLTHLRALLRTLQFLFHHTLKWNDWKSKSFKALFIINLQHSFFLGQMKNRPRLIIKKGQQWNKFNLWKPIRTQKDGQKIPRLHVVVVCFSISIFSFHVHFSKEIILTYNNWFFVWLKISKYLTNLLVFSSNFLSESEYIALAS